MGEASSPETNAQAIRRLEEERRRLIAARNLDQGRIDAETGGAAGSEAVPVDSRHSAPGMGSAGQQRLTEVEADLQRRRAVEARAREQAAMLKDVRDRDRFQVEADEITRATRPLGVQIEGVTEKVTKLKRAFGEDMAGASEESRRALAGLENQLADLNKVAADGSTLDAYKRKRQAEVEQRAAGMVGPSRDKYLAEQRQEIELIGTATSKAERKAQVDAAGATVTNGQTQAIAAQNAQNTVAVRGAVAAADAYRESMAAGIEADARRQAQSEAVTSAIDVEARTRQIVAEKAGDEAVSLAQATQQLELETDARRQVVVATDDGVAARMEAERQAQVAKVTSTALAAAQAAEATGNVDLAQRLRELAAGYDRVSKSAASLSKLDALKQYNQQQRDGLEQQRLEASLVGRTADERTRVLASHQAELQIRQRGIDISRELTAEERRAVEETRQLAAETAELQIATQHSRDAWEAVGGISGAALGAGGAALGAEILGLSAMGGPVGLAIGAIVGGIMGLVGTQKMSVGPNGEAIIKSGSNGFAVSRSLTDNDGDEAKTKQLGDGAALALNTIVNAVGGGFAFSGSSEFGSVRFMEKTGKYTSRVAGGQDAEFDSADAAMQDFLRRTISRFDASGEISGLNADVRKALKTSVATTSEDLANDLTFAAGFRATFDAMRASMDPVNNQIKVYTENAQKLGEQIKTNITDWKDKAAELGLATDTELIAAARKGITAMIGLGTAAEPLRGVAAVTKQAEIEFEAFRPALLALGYTAAEVADMAVQYTAKLVRARADAVAITQREGAAAIAALTDPLAKTSALDRLDGLGLDRTSGVIAGLAQVIDNVEAAAVRGTLSIEDERWALAQLDRQLDAGYLSADQYTAAVGYLTQAWADNTTVVDEAARKAKEVTQAERELAAYRADITSRTYAAVGQDRASGLIALDQQQARELADAQANGYDVTQLVQLQGAERATKAFTLAQADVLAAYDQQIVAQQDYISGLQAGAVVLEQVARQFRKVRDNLAISEDAPISPQERIEEAERQWAAALKTYRDADASQADRDAAAQTLQQLAPTLTSIEKTNSAGTARALYDEVMRVLDELGGIEPADGVTAEKQLEAAQASLKELQQGRKDAASLGQKQYGALTDLLSVMNQSYVVQQAMLLPLQQMTGTKTSATVDQMIAGITATTLPDAIAWAKAQGPDALQQVIVGANKKLGWENNPYRYQAPGDVASMDGTGFTSADALGFLAQYGYRGAYDDNANAFIVAHGLADQFTAFLRDFKARNSIDGKRARLEAFNVDQIEAAFGSMPDIRAARQADPAFDLARWFRNFGINEVLNGQRSIPGFAAGGLHSGGLRVVGERGWELEATGPARIWTADQIATAVAAARGDLGPNVVGFLPAGRDGGAGAAALIRAVESVGGKVDRLSGRIEDFARAEAQQRGGIADDLARGLAAIKDEVADLPHRIAAHG